MSAKIRILQYFAIGLAGLGYFLPWIDPIPAALKLSGYDLVEWLTFAAGVRDGSFAVSRVDVLLPLITVALLIPSIRLTGFKYLIVIVLAVITAFLVLPTYPFILTAHTDPELRPQLVAGILTFVGVGMMTALTISAPRLVESIGGLLAVSGIVVSIRAYALASLAIADVFTRPAPIGSGIILIVIGFALYAASSIVILYGKIPQLKRV